MTDPNRGQECPPQADPPRAGKPLTQAELADLAAEDDGNERELVDEVRNWRALVERFDNFGFLRVADEHCYFCDADFTNSPDLDAPHYEDCMWAEARRRLKESK